MKSKGDQSSTKHQLCRNLVIRKCSHGRQCADPVCVKKKCNRGVECQYSHDINGFQLVYISTKSFYDHAGVYNEKKLGESVLSKLHAKLTNAQVKNYSKDLHFVSFDNKWIVYAIRLNNNVDQVEEVLREISEETDLKESTLYLPSVGGRLYLDRNKTFGDQLYDAAFLVPYRGNEIFIGRKKHGNINYPIGGKRDYSNTEDDAWDCAVREFLEETYNSPISRLLIDMREDAYEEVVEEPNFIMTLFFVDAQMLDSALFSENHVHQIQQLCLERGISKEDELMLAKFMNGDNAVRPDPKLLKKLHQMSCQDLNSFYNSINNVESNQSLFITELSDFGWKSIQQLQQASLDGGKDRDILTYIIDGVNKAKAIRNWAN